MNLKFFLVASEELIQVDLNVLVGVIRVTLENLMQIILEVIIRAIWITLENLMQIVLEVIIRVISITLEYFIWVMGIGLEDFDSQATKLQKSDAFLIKYHLILNYASMYHHKIRSQGYFRLEVFFIIVYQL